MNIVGVYKEIQDQHMNIVRLRFVQFKHKWWCGIQERFLNIIRFR